MPVAELGGFVVIEPEVHAERHLLERRAEIEVRRRREDRVRPEDEEHLDPTRGHVGDEFGDRCAAIDRRCGHRRVVGHRGADVAERLVHRARERVDRGRLMVAGHNHRRSAVRAEVLGDGWNPARGDIVRQRARRGAGNAQRRRERARKRQHVARLERETMIGVCARDRRNRLDGVEPVELIARRAHAATRREVLGVANRGRAKAKEIGVERDDDVGPIEAVERRRRRRSALRDAEDRIPLVPPGLRHGRQQRLDLIDERRRRDRFRQDSDAGATFRAFGSKRGVDRLDHYAPRLHFAPVDHVSRSVRVVQRQHRGLGENVGGSEAGRVLGIALELGWPAHVVLGEHRHADAAERHRSREEERAARGRFPRVAGRRERSSREAAGCRRSRRRVPARRPST